MRRLVVALDGPGSSGKSSVGAAAARTVGYRFCDTGLLYRAVTWLAEARGVGVDDAEGLVALVDEVQLAEDEVGRLARVLVDGVDHTADVRSPAVDAAVSAVSAVGDVRAALLTRQRALAADGHAVLVASHDVEFIAQAADDAVVMADGEVVSRGPARRVVAESPAFAPQVTKVLGPPWLRVDEVVAALETA